MYNSTLFYPTRRNIIINKRNICPIINLGASHYHLRKGVCVCLSVPYSTKSDPINNNDVNNNPNPNAPKNPDSKSLTIVNSKTNTSMVKKSTPIKPYYSFYIGLKKGLLTPTLPDHIIALQQNIFIRIFRVICGLNLLFILSHRYEYLPGDYYQTCLYISLIINILFMIYHMYISYHRIKHIYKTIKSGKIDIYNSPFNRFASYTARLSLCFKGVCDTSIYVGGVLGSCAITDELLKLRGHKAVIMPFIAKIFVPASPLVK